MSQPLMDAQVLKERVRAIAAQRNTLVDLLEQPDLGSLRIDVNQAIEEVDDLLDDFYATFPEEKQ
jgi:hypothetical protein